MYNGSWCLRIKFYPLIFPHFLALFWFYDRTLKWMWHKIALIWRKDFGDVHG
ncbi:hypothetical protein SLEP1_g56320 [Rubroshorea leprosula]|uniref:Uncharacterized protein n=1 Tax=Rubroshorea leprosula TaxID=152421 RepID=A0AAV5MIG1_9ROSI|nr:hypothetical protein SLEP1_g56320 [Rubroshorea leprosula]